MARTIRVPRQPVAPRARLKPVVAPPPTRTIADLTKTAEPVPTPEVLAIDVIGEQIKKLDLIQGPLLGTEDSIVVRNGKAVRASTKQIADAGTVHDGGGRGMGRRAFIRNLEGLTEAQAEAIVALGADAIPLDAAGIQWSFDTSNVDADPGAGAVRFDNSTAALTTLLYIDDVDLFGSSATAWLDALDDGGSSGARGRLRVAERGDASNYAEFNVTGTVVDGTGYRKVTVTYIAGPLVLTAAMPLVHTFNSIAAITFASQPQAQVGTDVGLPLNSLRTAQSIAYRVASGPLDFSAIGDGVTDDSANYTSADAANTELYLPGGRTFNTDSYVPTKPVYGPGKLLIEGTTIAGMQLTYDAVYSNVIYAPNELAHGTAYGPAGQGGQFGLPPDSDTVSHFNVVIAPGWRYGLATFPANNDIRRSTFVGADSALILEEAERVESFGCNAHKFAKLSSRNSGFGSLTFAWIGQNVTLDSSGIMYGHPIFYDELLQVPYTNATWDAGFVETINPGMRAIIVAWASGGNWPTDKDECERNAAFARDALQSLIVGRENAGFGYRALTLLLAGSRNAAFGAEALHYSLFDSFNTAMGSFTAYYHQEGDANLYAGYVAGYNHLKGDHNVILGTAAGFSLDNAMWEGSYNVFIGTDAGRDVDGSIAANMSDKFYLQSHYLRNPLISGDFDIGIVGMNLPKANAVRTRVHLFDGASGLAIGTAISGIHSDLLIESDTHSGIGFLTPANMVQGLYFYEADATFSASLVYDHSVDRFRIKCAAEANGAEFGAAGYFKIEELPIASPGVGTKQFWVDTADGNTVKFAV